MTNCLSILVIHCSFIQNNLGRCTRVLRIDNAKSKIIYVSKETYILHLEGSSGMDGAITTLATGNTLNIFYIHFFVPFTSIYFLNFILLHYNNNNPIFGIIDLLILEQCDLEVFPLYIGCATILKHIFIYSGITCQDVLWVAFYPGL